jgi:tetratricopeptide (TPR) repeat protein
MTTGCRKRRRRTHESPLAGNRSHHFGFGCLVLVLVWMDQRASSAFSALSPIYSRTASSYHWQLYSTTSTARPRPHRPSFSARHKQQICDWFRQAKTLERTGQWRTAVQVYQQILETDSRDAHSYLALARLQAKRGDHTAAQSVFSLGTDACPNSIHLWQAWAVYEETVTGNLTEAQRLFERALLIDADSPHVCHAYGLMQRKLGNLPQAVTLWERALHNSSTAALVCSLGELWIAQGHFERARQLYLDNIDRLSTPREKTEVYLALAWLEERYFSNREGAEQWLTTAYRISPQSTLAPVALARLDGRRYQEHGPQHAVRNATVHRLAAACRNGKSAPIDGRIYNAWAHLEVQAQRVSEARRILYEGLARYPEDHSLLQAAGKVEERLGNLTGARDLYGASLSIQPSAPTLVAYALLELRHPTAASNFNTTAKRLFEEALMIDRRHGPAYNAYARAVAEHEGVTAARQIWERGLRANCTDAASIYHGYARLELSLGNVQRARELLWQGHAQVGRIHMGTDSPHRERAVFLAHTLGMLELNSHRPAVALEVFVDGMQRYGNSSQLLLGAALCSVQLGDEKSARTWFEQAVSADEKHAQAWRAWGMMEMRAGNWKTAQTLFECGIRSAPRHGALWHAYGVLESRLGNSEASRVLFEKGIQVAPHHVALYQSWAALEVREGHFDVAKALIARGLTRDKRNGAGWMIAADIEERLGNHGLAVLLLRRGIECCPSNAQLYRSLGDAFVRQGKILPARGILEEGLQVDPTYAPLYHSLAELEARIGNVAGLAKLNERASLIFNTNVLEPTLSASEVWGSKIKAGREHQVPQRVAALAQRIVDEENPVIDEGKHLVSSNFLDGLMNSYDLERGWMGDLLDLDEAATVLSVKNNGTTATMC